MRCRSPYGCVCHYDGFGFATEEATDMAYFMQSMCYVRGAPQVVNLGGPHGTQGNPSAGVVMTRGGHQHLHIGRMLDIDLISELRSK
jgi:hypothetical protein